MMSSKEALSLKVVPVSYLRFSTSPILHRDRLSAIPLGMVLTFTVHLHANTGEVLHSHNSLLTFTTNRDDLVQVGRGPCNNSLTVRTVNIGLTLLAVWDEENTGMADYLALPVQHAIHPEDATMLVVGDVVCLSTQHLSPQGVPGTWSSSSTGVLKTYREVVVEGPTRTAVRGDKDTRVLLTTREGGNNLIGSCSSAQTASIALLHPETSVSCLLSFTSDAVEFSAHNVYLTNTSFDPSTGFYSCSLTLQPLSDQQTRVLSLSMTSLLVSAGVKGSAFSGEQVCARLPVETGLYSDQTELLLSNLQPSAELTVYGPASALDSLKVSSSSLSISVQERGVSNGFPSFLKYMVSAMDPQAAASASVSITSSSTGHTLVIPVTLIHVADPSTTMQAAAPVVTMEGAHFLQGFIDSYQMMFFTIFTLLTGTAIIIIVCHALFSEKDLAAFIQRTPPPSGFTSNSFVHKMTSPDPMSSHKPRLFSPDYYSR